MRPIEFRAWNTRLQEMEYIDDLYWFEENFCHHNGDNDYVIMQYTGLKDAKGNTVFEGDLIKNSADIIMVVFWDNEASAFFKKLPHHEGNEYAVGIRNMKFWNVIGNKYQHGELLNEQK